jgi:hypothetical protein
MQVELSSVDAIFVRRGIVAVILALTAFVLTVNITRPWVGYMSGAGADFGIMARNYLRFGYGVTKLGPVTNAGPAEPKEFRYYTHHPVMLPVLMSVSYRLFGVSAASARLVPIVFILAALLIWYQILLMQWDWATAVAGLFFLAFAPMTLFYGQVIEHEPLTLFFVLLTLWCYLLWMKNGSMAAYAGLLVSLLVGTQTGWPVYLIVPFLLLHYLTCGGMKSEQPWRILVLPIVAVGGFVIFLAHLWIIGGTGRFLDLLSAFSSRGFLNRHPLTPALPVRVILNLAYATYLYTPIALLLSGGWLILLGRKLTRRERLGIDVWPVLLLGFGLLWLILFCRGVVHAYYTFYLGPFVALSAALATVAVYHWASAKRRGWAMFGIVVAVAFFSAQALLHTQYIRTFRQGEDWALYRLGLWIKENSSPERKVLVLAERQYKHHVVEYYAERDLAFVGPELAAAYLMPNTQSLRFHYVIAPAESRDGGQMAALRCDWPPLEGYSCFDVPSVGLAIQARGPAIMLRTIGRSASSILENPHRGAGGAWRLVVDKLKAFLAR